MGVTPQVMLRHIFLLILTEYTHHLMLVSSPLMVKTVHVNVEKSLLLVPSTIFQSSLCEYYFSCQEICNAVAGTRVSSNGAGKTQGLSLDFMHYGMQ